MDDATKRSGQGRALFPLGQTMSTPGALATLTGEELLDALGRHARGDWGDCSPEDAAANDQALLDGSRLFSVYHTAGGVKFWIITEADRGVTTVLLPDEY
jgi:hypothetical protein